MMKRLLLVISLILFAGPVCAEKPGEVLVRYGRQDNAVRIVLEGPDALLKNANTITSLVSVKIEFPGAVEIKKPKDFIFETSQKDRLFVITLREVADAKTYKLVSPSRIVIDLKMAATQAKKDPPQPLEQKQAPKPAQEPPKPQKDTPAAADAQKSPQPAGSSAPQKQPAQGQASAPAPEKLRKIKTIVIDAGHGGFDHGITVGDIREKDVMLALSKDIVTALSKKGITVFPTRKTDQNAPLAERIGFAAAKKADLFISMHATRSESPALYSANPDDTNIDPAVRGYTSAARVARHFEKSRLFSKMFGSSIRDEFKTTVLLRELPLPLLTSVDAPSVLVEFPLTGPSSFDQKMRDRIVKSLLSGISAYEQ